MKCEAIEACKKNPPKVELKGKAIQEFCECHAASNTSIKSQKLMGIISDKEMEKMNADAIKECAQENNGQVSPEKP